MALGLIPPEFIPGRAQNANVLEGIASTNKKLYPSDAAVNRALREFQPDTKVAMQETAKVTLDTDAPRIQRGIFDYSMYSYLFRQRYCP